ncbi:MAG: diacylglycerol kinase family lipid kinase [Thermoanaerobaculum sp.]|nr:diacylglycerol kinase family lipid kinase [Thermoanaerobaculum sp.]
MLVIVNPAAAGGRLGRQWPRWQSLLESLGMRVPQAFTRAPGHATELAEEAVEKGTETVVAAGGDGTICEVAEGLHRAGKGILGILPLGTGNDTARTLGIPRHLPAAVATLRRQKARRIDLMQVGERVVVNALGLGLLGTINRRAARLKKVRGFAAYLAAAVYSLARYRPTRINLEANGFSYSGPLTILAVQNGPTTGGGFRLTPAATPDDGTLDACLVEGTGMWARIPRLWAGLRGHLHRWRGSHSFTFQSLRLHLESPLDAHLDGNPWVVPAGTLHIRVRPQALTVLGAPEPN